MVQIIKDEFQRLGVGLIDLYDLWDATGIKWLIFDVAEVTKNFVNFILHVKFIKSNIKVGVFKWAKKSWVCMIVE